MQEENRIKQTDAIDQHIQIAKHFGEIMKVLGLDLEDESLRNTPNRVAKMYVNELFKGLNEDCAPVITTFPNTEGYNQILVERNIRLVSVCEHHFVPIIGKVHIAYIPGERVIGLSKFHRVVDFLASKPQLQERLTQEIGAYFVNILETEDVAVVVDAVHHCCGIRGVKDINSSTMTSYMSGKFGELSVKEELFKLITM